ncbi:dihydrofolate reductase family protein [Asanoa siamensis]|uniref:Riboflavin biosynthesis protein n=1 Tax=Asanoa siamensis TaxID=926357 RepID=A0ABQ4CUJ8_9ACTN|nr:dihydrofolate reductase family protein [Asanoa siamensis]GIF74955.1 riboflavin biosynthesis protein [Asanoa siamensis]
MSKVVLDVSASLDGFTAGPDVRAEVPMGAGGEALHEWMATDVDVRREVDAAVGAVVVGRHTFDLGLPLWGGTPWPGVPTFVVTHRPRPDFVGDNGGAFGFGTLTDAVSRAKEAAGDKDVYVMGADVARQVLRAGLLDEICLHLVPILLGGGTRLFDGEIADVSPVAGTVVGTATHLRYAVGRRSE